MTDTVTVTVPRWALEYVLNFAVPDYPVPTLDGRKWISACEALGRALDTKADEPATFSWEPHPALRTPVNLKEHKGDV